MKQFFQWYTPDKQQNLNQNLNVVPVYAIISISDLSHGITS